MLNGWLQICKTIKMNQYYHKYKRKKFQPLKLKNLSNIFYKFLTSQAGGMWKKVEIAQFINQTPRQQYINKNHHCYIAPFNQFEGNIYSWESLEITCCHSNAESCLALAENFKIIATPLINLLAKLWYI